MLKANLAELDLIGVPFPVGFVPRFYAAHDPTNEGTCWWHVFSSRPEWESSSGYWISGGDSYEIGIYESGGDLPPEVIAKLKPENSLIEII